MKHSLFTIWLALMISGCSAGSKKENEENTAMNPTPAKSTAPVDSAGHVIAEPSEDQSQAELEFKEFTKYRLTDPIIDDFNGDQQADTARFERRNDKAGIVIKDGQTGKETVIGCGNAFEEMGDDFSWVDEWGILRDKLTYEVIIRDSEIIGGEEFILDHPSLYVRKEEVGGGVITWKNGKYTWVHQAD